jgi:hypothetical protein
MAMSTAVRSPGAQYLPFSYHIGTAYLYELPSMLIFVFLCCVAIRSWVRAWPPPGLEEATA